MRKVYTLTRRGFLQRAALAGGVVVAFPTIIPSSALGADGAVAPSERVVVGCIGVGDRGSYLLQSLLELPEAQVVAVADVKRDRRDTARNLINTTYANQDGKDYNDLEELLAREDIDACTVATCDHWHVLAAVKAVRAGKDVYVEKPLGISIEQDQIMRQAVRDTGRIFQFGTQQRSDRRFHQACEMALNGIVGELKTINVWAPPSISGGSLEEAPVPETLDYERWLGPAPKVPYTVERDSNKWWWFNSDYAIGFIAGWGIHPIDIALWGAGERCKTPVEIDGTGTFPTEGFCNTATTWKIDCRYDSGVTIDYRHDPAPAEWKERYRETSGHGTAFEGTEGWVHVNRSHITASSDKLLTAPMPANAIRLPESAHHMKNYLASVRSRQQPISDIDSAVQGDILCQICDIGLRLKRKLHWDAAAEKFVNDDEANARLKVAMRAPWGLV